MECQPLFVIIFMENGYGRFCKKRKPLLSSDAFFLGVQGPDVFYFHRALPWHKKKETSLRTWGDTFHQENPAEAVSDASATV